MISQKKWLPKQGLQNVNIDGHTNKDGEVHKGLPLDEELQILMAAERGRIPCLLRSMLPDWSSKSK